MNDFTKEELEQITTWATTDVDLKPSQLEIKLFEKIQSMVAKYNSPAPNYELEKFINNQLAKVAKTLPRCIEEDPGSFSCGHEMGYKRALLEMDRIITKEEEW